MGLVITGIKFNGLREVAERAIEVARVGEANPLSEIFFLVFRVYFDRSILLAYCLPILFS